MHLHRVRDALLHELTTTAAQSRFTINFRTEPALCALHEPAAILAALHDRSTCAKAKNDIVVALIRAAQSRRGPEPVALLIVAFLPGLAAICRAARPRVRSALEDCLEQLVVESFIEVVHTFPLETQARTATMGLVFATRRAVLRSLRRSRADRQRDPIPVDEHRDIAATLIDPEGLLLCREISPMLSMETLHQALRSVGISSELAQSILQAPFAAGSRQRARTGENAHARRAYWRVCRARHRLLNGTRIRTLREQLSSLREHLPLLQQEGWQ